jgi:hypothetical protein
MAMARTEKYGIKISWNEFKKANDTKKIFMKVVINIKILHHKNVRVNYLSKLFFTIQRLKHQALQFPLNVSLNEKGRN